MLQSQFRKEYQKHPRYFEQRMQYKNLEASIVRAEGRQVGSTTGFSVCHFGKFESLCVPELGTCKQRTLLGGLCASRCLERQETEAIAETQETEAVPSIAARERTYPSDHFQKLCEFICRM